MLSSDILKVFCGFVAGYIAKEISLRLFTIGFYLRFMKAVEVEMLLLITEYRKLMYTGIQALEIAYEKVSETDPEQKESYKVFRNAFEDKLKRMGDEWIVRLKKKLPYKTNYSNLKEAIVYFDSLLDNRVGEKQGRYMNGDGNGRGGG